MRNEDIGNKNITRPLLLAIEILSPSTRRYDLLTKRSKYEDCGVESYWIADPLKPSLTAFQLVSGHYQIVADVSGPETAHLEAPFPIQVTPARLVTR